MEAIGTNNMAHKIVLIGRETMSVEGVENVVSFDEKQVILDTTKGRLVIKGAGLHVKRLSLEKGIIDFEGSVDNMDYVSIKRSSEESLFSRLFG